MSQEASANKKRRRPGRDPEEAPTVEVAESTADVNSEPKSDEIEDTISQANNSGAASASSSQEETQSNMGADGWGDDLDSVATEEEKTRLEFYGSELIRLKAPKVMDVADQVVHDWTHEGKFEGLPVGHPLAQIAVAKGLQTAKQVEKKLEEKGVFALAKMGIELAKSKFKK